MAQPATLAVHVEVLGHRFGLWCRRCAFGSAVRAYVALTVAGRLSLLVRDQCLDCGSHDVEPPA